MPLLILLVALVVVAAAAVMFGADSRALDRPVRGGLR
jgi:hypothetical protein